MPLLEMQNVVKEFAGVRALDDIDLSLEAAEIHAVVGENGAGKSTLMKILSGVYPSGTFSGRIRIEGETKRHRGVRDSESAGIAIIFQELSLVKELTVGENIFLGREPSRFGVIDWPSLYQNALELLRSFGLHIDPRQKTGNLGIGQQQLVEIAKALSQNARILILDEPTAALTQNEVETLFDILQRLRRRGVGMIYISHKLEEVFRISDRITVLRDGKTVASFATSKANKNTVIAAMVGREVENIFPQRTHECGAVAIDVRNLTVYSTSGAQKKLVDNVSFKVRKGEVLGIAGLMGAGRTELLTALFGACEGNHSCAIEIDGQPLTINSPADAIAAGIGFVTEDRKRYGLIVSQSIADNITLAASGPLSRKFLRDRNFERTAANGMMRSLGVKGKSPAQAVQELSGGNQQKVVLGKWLLTNPKILFLDEPTRGIDVGAKQEIYAEIDKLAQDGLAIVLVSSELSEVIGLSDRVIVLRQGKVAAEFSRGQATAEKVMAAATA